MTGIAVGLTKGHVVSRRKLATRPGQRKGVCRISCLCLTNRALQSAFVCSLRFIFPVVTHATPPLAEARKARQDDSRTSARRRW